MIVNAVKLIKGNLPRSSKPPESYAFILEACPNEALREIRGADLLEFADSKKSMGETGCL